MNSRSKHLTHYFRFTAALWSAAILFLFVMDCWHINRSVEELVLIEARAYLDKEQALSRWAASHGGVYVPVSETVQPDPALAHKSERDILTPQGRLLTLMNPARLIRGVMEENEQLHHVRGRIASLNFTNEDTAPDAWEKQALRTIEAGCPEVWEFCKLGGQKHLRIMQPLRIEASCLKCHNDQGYKVGDSRGGFSISVPMRRYLDHDRKEMTSHAISFIILWGLGIGGLWLAASQLSHYMKKKDESDALLKVAQKNYQTLVDNSLTGIYISQNFRVKFCNARFAQIHGFSSDELIEKDTKELIHPLDQAYMVEMHKNRMQGLSAPEEYEIRCITADGRVIWVLRRNSIIIHNGQPAVLGNEIDITDKKKAEEALRASEAQLKRLVVRLIRRHEVERKSIALEIHEEIAQTLSAIKMNIEEMLAGDPSGSSPELAMLPIVDRIKDTINMIRGLTKRLSPIMLDDLGIITAISTLCREVMESCRGSNIATRLEVDESSIPGEMKIVIYRILEELFALSSKYCLIRNWVIALNKKNGAIELAFEEIGPNLVQSLKEAEWQLGIAVIQSQTEAFGGTLTINAEENKNTITISWPMNSMPRL